MAVRKTKADLDRLQQLLSWGTLSPGEEAQIRIAAVVQLQGAAQAYALPEAERRVLGLLLSRWAQAFEDNEQNLHFLTDRFEAGQTSLAQVLNLPAPELETALSALTRKGLIAVHGVTHAAITGLLENSAADLCELLYRDFLDRQGSRLIEFGLAAVGELAGNIVELEEEGCSAPVLKQLQSAHQLLKAKHPRKALKRSWMDRPGDVYAWLGEVAALEEKASILKGQATISVAWLLQNEAQARVAILSGQLAPSQAL